MLDQVLQQIEDEFRAKMAVHWLASDEVTKWCEESRTLLGDEICDPVPNQAMRGFNAGRAARESEAA